jgi:hypothetical protein
MSKTNFILILCLALPLALAGCADDFMTDVGEPALTAEAPTAEAKGCSYSPSSTFDSYDTTSGSFHRAGNLTVAFSCAGVAVFFDAQSDYPNGANQDTGCTTHTVSAKVYVNGVLQASVSDAESNKALDAFVNADFYEGSDFESGDVFTATVRHYFVPNNPTCATRAFGQKYVETLSVNVP